MICHLIIMLVVLTAAASCSNPPTPNPTPIDNILTSTATLPEVMKTSTTTPVIFPLITSSITPFPSTTAAPSVIVTITPTRTPRSTLEKNWAQALAYGYLKTNGGCLLPCWWGLTPGLTTWDDADSFFSTLDSKINTLRLDSYRIDKYGVIINLPQENSEYDLSSGTFYVKSGLIDSMMVQIDMPLYAMLSKYGSPDEIYLRARGFVMAHYNGWFTLVLFYQKKGMLVRYDGISNQGLIVGFCPVNIDKRLPLSLLWNTKNPMTFEEAAEVMSLISPVPPPSLDDYHPVSKISKMDVNTFYETYKNPKNVSTCLEVPGTDR
jgi:hypothetical protein